MLNSQLRRLGNKFLALTSEDRLLALSEGFLKVRCAEAALALGWTLQEGVGNKGSADFASLSNGSIVWRRSDRILFALEGSADLAIVSPLNMLLEIKARPDHGTKSQAQFEQMDYDVARVAADPRCAMLFVFEPRMYRSFSAEKQESRGRRALTSGWFNRHFPKLQSIPEDRYASICAERDGEILTLAFRRCPHGGADGIILVLGCREDR